MRFDPCRCPECNTPAHRTGGSPKSGLSESGCATLRCDGGHEWPALDIEESGAPPNGRGRRLGRICVPGYVVDLDDPAMVGRARSALLDDLEDAAVKTGLGDFVSTMTVEQFAEGSPASWLTETDEEIA